MFIYLAALYRLLLYRYSGQTDFAIGAPAAWRPHDVFENTIGVFTDNIALRNPLIPDETFNDLLKREADGSLEVFDNLALPFGKIVDLLIKRPDPGRHPIFQVMLVFQNYPRPSTAFTHLDYRMHIHGNNTAKVDITLDAALTNGILECRFEYARALFTESQITQLATHFEQLVKESIANPERILSEIPLLTSEEYGLMESWNDTAQKMPEEDTPELIRQQALAAPDREILFFEDKGYTYKWLLDTSEQLAPVIASRLGKSRLVALFGKRSPEMIALLLATWQAGGVYLYLDPEYPDERLRYMIEDSTPDVIIRVDINDRLTVIPMTSYNELTEAEATSWEISPNEIAYVIYTSGSTGKPKGVQIYHRGITNFLLSMKKKPGISQEDRLLAITPLSFDISVLEIFLPLITGARLYLLEREKSLDARSLAEAVTKNEITIMQATPSTWLMLMEIGFKERIKALCGGEALPQRLAGLLLPNVSELWNMYGPTETTVWSSIYLIEDATAPILIGKPINNTTMYLLDSALSQVPAGVYGELYIGGEGVGAGYLNLGELTNERFVANPFGEGRLYRTGDLVRWLP
ncbi:MAG: amino acid adenylation domain-containing protein, partial [Candidatus Cloacimonetes bacterium]|nr:amino acid adenylation domain-containing protein [Candidatus Cloacimonadota bacterium]